VVRDDVAQVPVQQTTQILDVMKRRAVAKGEVIISQGEVGKEFYILDEGEVRTRMPPLVAHTCTCCCTGTGNGPAQALWCRCWHWSAVPFPFPFP
jgi:hypothetical protein